MPRLGQHQGWQIFNDDFLLEHLRYVLSNQVPDQLLKHVFQGTISNDFSGPGSGLPVPAVFLSVDDLQDVVVEAFDVFH